MYELEIGIEKFNYYRLELYQKDGILIVYKQFNCTVIDYNLTSKRENIIDCQLIKINFFSIVIKLVLKQIITDYQRSKLVGAGNFEITSVFLTNRLRPENLNLKRDYRVYFFVWYSIFHLN